MHGERFDRITRGMTSTRASRRAALWRIAQLSPVALFSAVAPGPKALAQETGPGTCCLWFRDEDGQLEARVCSNSSCFGGTSTTTVESVDVDTCDLCPAYPS